MENQENVKVEDTEKEVVAETTEIKENVEVEIPQSFLDKIEQDFGDPKEETETKEAVTEKELTEFDKFSSDPLNKLFLEFRESGHPDFKQFLEQGGYDFKEPSVEELIKADLEMQGLKDEKLELALERRLSVYEDLTEGEQEVEINKLKSISTTKKTGVLMDYAKNIEAEKQRYKEVETKSTTELDSTLNNYLGKPYMNVITIPEADKNELRTMAMQFALPITDDKGKVIGHDVKAAINLAITHKYGKLMIKEAKIQAYKEAYMELHKKVNNISTGEKKTQQAKTSDISKDEALRKLRQS